jgi:hypothetical protein
MRGSWGFILLREAIEEKERDSLHMKDERTFKLHWLDGKVTEISGKDIKDAFWKAGYGLGVFGFLDYYEEI